MVGWLKESVIHKKIYEQREGFGGTLKEKIKSHLKMMKHPVFENKRISAIHMIWILKSYANNYPIIVC